MHARTDHRAVRCAGVVRTTQHDTRLWLSSTRVAIILVQLDRPLTSFSHTLSLSHMARSFGTEAR